MNSITTFVKKQISFVKFFGKNLFKPFSLDLINKEHEKELRLKNEIFKKHSLKTIEKSKLVMQVHAAQLKLFDISKELDYINQRKLYQQQQLIDSLNSLLSSIEIDSEGSIINKKKNKGPILPKGDLNCEAIQKQQEQQLKKLHQSNIQDQQQSASINDLDSIFNDQNNQNDTTIEYIDPNLFDYDSVFKKPEPFNQEKYLKELEERIKSGYEEKKININGKEN
ncbi:hypothetical protein DICPUDRAFT_91480 [Dictyostelium purpureum]|uniref:Uncharacterized protein n=1 Tax=Dictyostelium purpureum TaxID=5786 RepID=F0ZD28_DICPU|nr:uncharacterized protein DICPUDRAFT_91480 [Dictyostelium purpureum]EGC38170.1 hypothetical protein DICPUDRAFT_91480 [Dictyostelium purpureum]|eukprot:XP_003285297.1 hypothetical protein DICPUDRAFT_91480 [Dictyostelium purpureum]